MKPAFHPTFVNGRFGDPAVHVAVRRREGAVLLDCGELHALTPRRLLRLDAVLVSHAHVDHFVGFDHLLRVVLARGRRLRLVGPAGFVGHVAARLGGYTWNLAEAMADDLVLDVLEVRGPGDAVRAVFRLKERFRRADADPDLDGDVVWRRDGLRARAAVVDHGIPCLAYVLEEERAVDVHLARLLDRGLGRGPWLDELRRAVLDGAPDDTPIAAGDRTVPLGALRDAVGVGAGQRLGYVTDLRYTRDNVATVVELVRDVDLLVIEARFRAADAQIAAARSHLTTAWAGAIARQAGARRVEPFHFSVRYRGQEDAMREEVAEAFQGRVVVPPPA